MKTLLILLMPLSILATDVIDFTSLPFWNLKNPEPVRKFTAKGRDVYIGKFRDEENLCYVIVSEEGSGISCLFQ